MTTPLIYHSLSLGGNREALASPSGFPHDVSVLKQSITFTEAQLRPHSDANAPSLFKTHCVAGINDREGATKMKTSAGGNLRTYFSSDYHTRGC